MPNLEKLQKWLLYTPPGRYTLTNERIFYHKSVQNVFGYYSLQIGFPEINFLQGNKIPFHYVVGHDIKCMPGFLPFENNSIDLIVCPHVLEYTDNYIHLLEECYRILIPNGKLILTSFSNNYWCTNFTKKPESLADAKPLNLDTLKEQLIGLNYTITGGKFYCYRPLINKAKMLSRLSWLDKVGDRWFPTMANNFGLIATKEILTPTPILPSTQNMYSPAFEGTLGTAKICKHN